MKLIAEKIKIGDEIRVIAPSSSLQIIDNENIRRAVNTIETLGLKVTFGKHVNEFDMMSSSSIESRIEDLHEAFSDRNVKAILSVIGGFNANQLLKYIDYDLIKKNPKIFCGYSDITALQNAIYHQSGLVTYSGPHFSTFAMKQGFEYTLEYFKSLFFEKNTIDIKPSQQWSDDAWFLDQENRNFNENDGYWIIQEGKAKGTIIGGSLSTFQLLHGTSFMPSLENTVLFIEADSISDGNVDIYEFDRDLQSLMQQPNFDKVKGILIGRFENKFKINVEKLKYIIRTKKELKNLPIIANADFGHTNPIFTYPVGGICEISAHQQQVHIKLSES
ncbi:MAG: LD-carboxypeptidase [Gammaproteobacteria bacterium]|jgi:muramoyltetrapeptide carboxypeptidase LdcA involved in peptidoglycan recycling|nr:LD-carboxypeptidase [Gammaproteobacteria bacterium]